MRLVLVAAAEERGNGSLVPPFPIIMPGSGFLLFWSVLTAAVAALSLGPSFAHVLEAPPRLAWPPDLWRETTVFNAQFWLFAAVGAPLDIAAILCPGVLSFLLRHDAPALRLALAATVLYVMALAAWLLLVNPANAVLAGWTPGPIPPNFDAIRLRWEAGHMVVAAFKLAGFLSLAFALLSMRRG
jgi:hypothetical protein